MNWESDEGQRVAAIQAAVVTAINALGVVLIGSDFNPIESSPIPDTQVAEIMADVLAADNQPQESSDE